MVECENLSKCRFFEMLQGSDLKDIVPELVALYCRGPFVSECRRRQYIEQGVMPRRELSPTGIPFNL